jgi:hypothetical protein
MLAYFSRRACLKAALLLAFFLHISNASTTKKVGQLSVREIEEELQVGTTSILLALLMSIFVDFTLGILCHERCSAC